MTIADKPRLMRLRQRAVAGDLSALYYARPETDARTLLKDLGFSDRMIEPFFAVVFFEPELAVSSRAFEFVLRAFALGDTALPAQCLRYAPAVRAQAIHSVASPMRFSYVTAG